MFKAGDEVFVKAKVTNVSDDNDARVQISGWGSCWFRKDAVIPADKTYADGLRDAWELAKKIALEPKHGGFCNVDLYEIFGTASVVEIFKNNTAEEALAKIEAYEKEKEIKVGDEVIHETDSTKRQFFVTYIGGNMISGIEKNGDMHGFSFPNQYIRKTGKHIDIESLLRQIGE